MATAQAPIDSGRRPDPISSALRRVGRNYYLQRLLKGLATVFVITTLTFFLIRLMPSNPLDVYIQAKLAEGLPLADAMEMASSIYRIDLNKPLFLQYLDYLGGLVQGDFGMSIASTGTPVSKLVLRFLPWTLFVVSVSLFISFTLGILLGTLMAYRRNGWFDHIMTAFASIMSTIPNYVVGILIIVYAGVQWKLFSVSGVRGSLSPGMKPGFTFAFFVDAFYHAALPITTYVLTTIGHWMLSMKSSTLATLGEDYVMVARARGLSDARIQTAYVARNAVLPLFTSLAISIGYIVGGSTLIEFVFTYQGIGLKLQSALVTRDYPVMQAVFIIICASVVAANVLADALYGWLDPRIRTSGR